MISQYSLIDFHITQWLSVWISPYRVVKSEYFNWKRRWCPLKPNRFHPHFPSCHPHFPSCHCKIWFMKSVLSVMFCGHEYDVCEVLQRSGSLCISVSSYLWCPRTAQILWPNSLQHPVTKNKCCFSRVYLLISTLLNDFQFKFPHLRWLKLKIGAVEVCYICAFRCPLSRQQ